MLTYEHGNKNGTGSRLCVEAESTPDGTGGRLRFELYRQSDCGGRGDGERRWEFRDDTPAIASLTVPQLAHALAVLRGDAENVLGGAGLVIRDEERTSLFHLDRETKPYKAFQVHIKTTWANGDRAEGRILLNPTEASALRGSIEGAMGSLAFKPF